MSSFKFDIDIKRFVGLLSEKKRQIAILMALTTVLAIIVAFSVPRIYKSRVVLAPESSSNSMTSGLSSLASMIGLYGDNNMTGDAIYPDIYPEIFNSTEFVTKLFDIKLKTTDSDKEVTLYDYLKKGQKKPWWTLPRKWIMSLLPKKKEEGNPTKIDPFHLTREQYNIVSGIQKSIFCAVDKKTGLITLELTAQDPLAAALLTDSIKNHLQEFITEYRTKKACNDLDYMHELYTEAKNDYTRARHAYAAFCDNNQDLRLMSYRSKEADLENDMQLKYNIYTQVVQQLQVAKAKVQEKTPAFTVVQNPVVPIRHSNTPKVFILATFLFLACFAYIAWIIVRHRRELIVVNW